MNEEIKWIFVQEVSVAGVSYEEYVSEDGKFGRLVYNDGKRKFTKLLKNVDSKAQV